MTDDAFAPMFAALLECRADDPNGRRSDDMQTIAARHGVDPLDLCRHWDAIRPQPPEKERRHDARRAAN